MDISDRDRQMYRTATHRAIMSEIRQLVQAALRGEGGDWGKREKHISRVVKLGLQQSYQEGMKRGSAMAMAAGRKALLEFINEHQPMNGEHMSDITFWTRASYKEEEE